MSTNNAFTSTPHNSTAANFRAWTNNVSAQFISAGWVRSGDTGNIDFTSVAAPTNPMDRMGYDIFKMQDTLQATAPIFVRVDYGAGFTSANNPGMLFQVGSGTDGVGGLTGAVSAKFPVFVANNSNASITYASGDTNRMCFAFWASGGLGTPVSNGNTFSTAHSPTVGLFSIERTKDASGNDTSDGAYISTRDPQSGSTVLFRQQYWNQKSGPGAIEDWGILYPTPNTTQMTSLTMSVYPQFFVKGGAFCNPGMNILGWTVPTLREDTPVKIHMYGSDHFYMPIPVPWGGANITSNRNIATMANCAFAMRFE